ncbi:restriction endonuclease subunit S [Fodinibius sp. SL11]|uniref:restriction endonuclease subunit S n=1 Tax=Fodinibius sp. SL11 TaxID=3425690 RepID=UPI003F882FDE
MRYRKSEELKETDVDWIGEIPQNWDFERLKSTIKFCQNGVWGDSPEDDQTDIPCIRVADFDRFLLEIPNQDFTIRSVPKDKRQGKVLKKGDLILEKSGGGDKQPVGAVMFYDLDKDAVCSNFTARMPVKKNYNSSFLRYVHYHLYHGRVNTRSIKQTTGIQNLDSSQYLNEKVGLPPPPEQDSIATFLDNKTNVIDQLIQKKEQLIEGLKEKRHALITQAVTKSLDPDVSMKDSGIEWLGKIPEHWDAIRIGALFKEVDDRGYPNLPLLEVTINHGVRERDLSEKKVHQVASDYNNYKKAAEGDIALNKMRAWQGAIGDVPMDGLVSPDYTVLRPRELSSTEFYGYLFQTSNFLTEIDRYSYGMVKDRNRIYWQYLKKIKVPVIAQEERENIVEYIRKVNETISEAARKIESEIKLFEEYRQSLISAAVTGKIDVRATEVQEKISEPRKEISSWDKFVLAMEIIKRMQDNQHFGRIMLVKILFLVEYHLRVKGFNSNYNRWDHGPFDNQLINSVEYNLKKDGWINIESEESKNYDQKVYTPTHKAYEKSHYFKNSWGELDDEIEQILSIFNDANSTQAEIIATVYAAYNDLLIEGKEPSEDKVLDEILNNWHPNKKKISEERWRSAYRWIKEKELLPTGFGKSTKETA